MGYKLYSLQEKHSEKSGTVKVKNLVTKIIFPSLDSIEKYLNSIDGYFSIKNDGTYEVRYYTSSGVPQITNYFFVETKQTSLFYLPLSFDELKEFLENDELSLINKPLFLKLSETPDYVNLKSTFTDYLLTINGNMLIDTSRIFDINQTFLGTTFTDYLKLEKILYNKGLIKSIERFDLSNIENDASLKELLINKLKKVIKT